MRLHNFVKLKYLILADKKYISCLMTGKTGKTVLSKISQLENGISNASVLNERKNTDLKKLTGNPVKIAYCKSRTLKKILD